MIETDLMHIPRHWTLHLKFQADVSLFSVSISVYFKNKPEQYFRILLFVIMHNQLLSIKTFSNG